MDRLIKECRASTMIERNTEVIIAASCASCSDYILLGDISRQIRLGLHCTEVFHYLNHLVDNCSPLLQLQGLHFFERAVAEVSLLEWVAGWRVGGVEQLAGWRVHSFSQEAERVGGAGLMWVEQNGNQASCKQLCSNKE